MLKKTSYQIPKELIEQALKQLPSDNFRYTINNPTGRFFYDPWEVKEEFKNTPWQEILDLLEAPIGEARIIILDPGKCYQAHADLDDRYHLNLMCDEAYLVDLENNELHKLQTDGIWYDMDAGRRHTAMNVGRRTRVQLVVRHLLKNNKLNNAAPIKIVFTDMTEDHARFTFDELLSPLLNRLNKIGAINDFEYSKTHVKMSIEAEFIPMLETVLPTNFRLEK